MICISCLLVNESLLCRGAGDEMSRDEVIKDKVRDSLFCCRIHVLLVRSELRILFVWLLFASHVERLGMMEELVSMRKTLVGGMRTP